MAAGDTHDRIASKMADKGGFGIASHDMIEAKGFNAHDGTGFSLARLGGIKAGIITKRISETVALARPRPQDRSRLPGPAGQGRSISTRFWRRRGYRAEEVCYVGDDVIDLPVMRLCGLAIAVKNSRPQVLREAHSSSPSTNGGHGAVRDAIEYVLREQGTLERVIDEYIASRSVQPKAD